MKHSDFNLGMVFWTADRQWRCTDIGTRVIVAICQTARKRGRGSDRIYPKATACFILR